MLQEQINWILRKFTHHEYGRWIHSNSGIVFNLDKIFAELTGMKINLHPQAAAI